MKILYILFCFFFASVSSFAQKAELIGRWEVMEDKNRVILTFDEDDSGSFDGMSFTYKIEGKELIATFFYGVFHYEFELSQDKTKVKLLTLKEGNLEHPYIFTKKESEAKGLQLAIKETDSSLIGTWADETNKVTFDSEGNVTINGTKYYYKTQRGLIKLYKGDTMEQAPYSVFQTTLAMAIDGEAVQLKKQK